MGKTKTLDSFFKKKKNVSQSEVNTHLDRPLVTNIDEHPSKCPRIELEKFVPPHLKS
jgi:hypothetical protein